MDLNLFFIWFCFAVPQLWLADILRSHFYLKKTISIAV
jgi:hypothetical protein